MAKESSANDDDSGKGWKGVRPSPHLWEKLKPLANQLRSEPTPAEQRLWEQLRKRRILGYKFRRQHAIDRFIVDFYCPEASLIVEVDGPIHEYTPVEDAVRQEYLESLGLQVIRFTNEEIFTSLDGVVEYIAEALGTSPGPHASSLVHGEDTALNEE
jgi:very-short-patch-repair endonuclease